MKMVSASRHRSGVAWQKSMETDLVDDHDGGSLEEVYWRSEW
jgi:hypothetical protein